MKIWNRVLLSLVAILVILAIIVFINVLFAQYRNEKIQFGSWSDWFNTATVLKNAAEEYNGLYSRIFIAEDEIALHFFADEKALDI